MIRYEANLNGTVSIGEPFTDFNELEILENIFINIGYSYKLKETGRGGYHNFLVVNEFQKEINIHIYLKRVTFGGRESRPYEKRIQFSAAIERSGFWNQISSNGDELSLILGIYKNVNFDDCIICGWDINEWGYNIGRAFNCFVDVNAIAKGYKNGFSQYKTSRGQIVCCFKPEYFNYYLNNLKALHSEIIVVSEYKTEDVNNQDLDLLNINYTDEIPNFTNLFQIVIDILKSHNGITNIDRIETDAGLLLNLTESAKFKVHNKNEGYRTEIGYQLAWSRFYLKKAGYIESPKRAIWALTEMGWNSVIDKNEIIRIATQKEVSNEVEDDSFDENQTENDIELEKNLDSHEIENPFNPNLVDIRTKTMSLDLIIKRLKTDAIDMNTTFQRKANLWNVVKQSRLIESILVRFPLPAFYFDGSDEDNWLVVDGLQRLSTLNNYVNLEAFPLENLEFLSQFNGKRFSELPISLQRRIEEFEITSYIIAASTPKILKFNVFKRINTGGLILTSQEIRNAIYQGKSTILIKKLADLRSFKVATSYTIPEDRMLDQEFVTRFLAFYLFDYNNYSSDLDSFLNSTLEHINLFLDVNIYEKIESDFDKAMRGSIQIFQGDAFRKRYSLVDNKKPINKALFEVWSVLLSKLNDSEINKLIENRNLLIEKFINLLQTNDDFNKSISSATGDKYRVRKRFSEINNIILSIL